jgi:hypothetical protein
MALTDKQRLRAQQLRAAMDAALTGIVTAGGASETETVNGAAAMIRQWHPGAYQVGDVRMYDGVPYKCVQAHDSTSNPGWTPPSVPALWMQYHGTSRETARPWVQPLGAHDQYLVGEWMIYHGAHYECVQNTVYTPDQYANAWRKG